jgi:hypothetical protein
LVAGVAFHLSLAALKNGVIPGPSWIGGPASLRRFRLAREENWGNSPRVASRIADAINLAKRIYDRLMSDYPKR